MDNQKIAEFLKALRKSKGYTQQQVADLLYISPKTISKWESGEGIPDISIISSVAAVYEITVDELLAGKRNTKNQVDKAISVQKAAVKVAIIKKLNIFLYTGFFLNFIMTIIAVALMTTIYYGIGVYILISSNILNVILIIMAYFDYKGRIRYEENQEVIAAHDELRVNVFRNIWFSVLGLVTLSSIVVLIIKLSNSNYRIVEAILVILLYVLIMAYIFKSIWDIIFSNQDMKHIKLKFTILMVISLVSVLLIGFYGFVYHVNVQWNPLYLTLDQDTITPIRTIFDIKMSKYSFFRWGYIIFILTTIISFTYVIWRKKHELIFFISSLLLIISAYFIRFDMKKVFHRSTYHGVSIELITYIGIVILIVVLFMIKKTKKQMSKLNLEQ